MDLPDDLDELEAQLDPTARYVVKLLRQSLDELKEQNARLSEQVAEFQRLLFGKRSEKLPPIESEVRRVVDKDELTIEGNPMPEEPKAKAHERRRKSRKKSEPERRLRRKRRKELPVVTERVDLQPDELPPGVSLADFRELGTRDVVRRVEHVREHLAVVEYHLQTLVSKSDDDVIIKAAPPAGVVEGGHYGPSLYAHVVTAKCADSLPLHRIERMLERAGASIARSSLCGLFHRSANLLSPIYDLILDTARNDPYLHADETTLKVQAEGECKRGWVWGLLSKQAIAYVFSESRSGEVAQKLLGGTKGVLIIDGYAAYNFVVDDDSRVRVGCWGHARRKFFEAMNTAPEAREVLEHIVDLYRIEHRAAELDILASDAHRVLRQTESAGVIQDIEAWVDRNDGVYPPKSTMGKAITYAKNQREALKRFLDDPNIPLDNNFAERGLRIIAIGRKNFLFAGHVEGAQNLAILQSVVATCRLHAVNPYEYIKDVLVRVQTHPARDIDQLLPWNWAPAA